MYSIVPSLLLGYEGSAQIWGHSQDYILCTSVTTTGYLHHGSQLPSNT